MAQTTRISASGHGGSGLSFLSTPRPSSSGNASMKNFSTYVMENSTAKSMVMTRFKDFAPRLERFEAEYVRVPSDLFRDSKQEFVRNPRKMSDPVRRQDSPEIIVPHRKKAHSLVGGVGHVPGLEGALPRMWTKEETLHLLADRDQRMRALRKKLQQQKEKSRSLYLDALDAKRSALEKEKELEQLQTTIAEAQERAEQEIERNHTIEQRSKQLMEKIDRLKEKLTKASGMVKRRDATIQELKTKIREGPGWEDKWQNAVGELEKATSRAEKSESQVNALQNETNELRSRLETAEKQLQKLKVEHKSALEERERSVRIAEEAAKTTVAHVQAQKDALAGKLAKKQEEVETARVAEKKALEDVRQARSLLEHAEAAARQSFEEELMKMRERETAKEMERARERERDRQSAAAYEESTRKEMGAMVANKQRLLDAELERVKASLAEKEAALEKKAQEALRQKEDAILQKVEGERLELQKKTADAEKVIQEATALRLKVKELQLHAFKKSGESERLAKVITEKDEVIALLERELEAARGRAGSRRK
eukprot:Rmarinus@m.21072